MKRMDATTSPGACLRWKDGKMSTPYQYVTDKPADNWTTEGFDDGKMILGVKGFVGNYQLQMVTEPLRKSLKKGTNTLAVHTHQTRGGQYIDLAVLVE